MSTGMRADSTAGYVTIRPLTHEDSVLYFPPEAFGPFRVLHQIGPGTLGPVFRPPEPGRDRLVAITIFRLDITPEQSAALVRELEQLIASHINHRAVAAPIAAGLDGHAAYLALEYVVGDSLDVSSRDAGPMPLTDVVRIVDGIASAIDACAANGVHHGLLHPRDVIMSVDWPRVTGLGIAEALTRIGLRLPVRRPYAPPEGVSDVYSLAAIAYELISGRRMTPTGWDEISAEDGPELRDAFAAGLSREPQGGPAAAGEFAAELRAALGERSAVPPPAIPETGPDFDTEQVDRFADGADSELHVDFVPPIERELEMTPELFEGGEAGESESGRGGGRTIIVLVLIALVVAGAAAYILIGRRAVQTASAKPPVAATTVDLPQVPSTVPAEPALPAPAPSPPASGVTSPERGRPAASPGRLLLRSTAAGAQVSINGQARGKTPLTARDLALGSYTIPLTQNGFAPADRRVLLTPRQPSESLEISLKPLNSLNSTSSTGAPPARNGPVPAVSSGSTGGMSVESRPAGARVFVNDRLVGSTPLAIPGLPAGAATVRIELDGYQPWVTKVRVGAG